jgi:glycosyltransferase involved in cell wall biosynthesis
MINLDKKKIAIVHYWWISNRGGEAVVKSFINLFPNADLYVHVCDEDKVKKELGSNFKGKIYKTFISKLPLASKHYQKYLPLMPFALESIDLTEYDLIISSEAGPAKGIISRPDSIHVCYCHSPMRYIWDMEHQYTRDMGRLKRYIFKFFSHYLRVWDVTSAARVDYFIANSSFIKKRIKKFYDKDSKIIFPPVSSKKFEHNKEREDFYLCLGQLVSYKRIDLAVKAFNDLGLKLIIIGEGEQFKYLNSIKNNNIELLGRQEFNVVRKHLETCKALIFPGTEDFGIVPVEAAASGAPVIAFKRGGALDTIIENKTGVFFDEQSKDALISAVRKFEENTTNFDSESISEHAKKFDESIFRENIKNYLSSILK